MAVQAITRGQRWEGKPGMAEGMRLEVLNVPRPPRAIEVRHEPGHGGARTVGVGGEDLGWATQGMTRAWLRRYYRLLP